MKTEIGEMHLQSRKMKDCWWPAEAEDPPQEPAEGTSPANTLILDVWPPEV